MANENEDARVAEAVQAILAVAVEHESHTGCPDTESHVCWDNRYILTAEVMHALGLGLSDIGFVAEAWMDIECQPSSPAEPASAEEAFGVDDVLNTD